jgi:hypothetical protein
MPECGATTASGSLCKRKVKEGHCFLHKEDGTEDQCSICLSNLTGACKTLPCNHCFHRRCIIAWKNRGNHTCPMCRAPFTEPPPQYRVTITVENMGQRRVFTSNVIPDVVNAMGILTPESYLTEVIMDVNTTDALSEVLADLGFQNVHDLFGPDNTHRT